MCIRDSPYRGADEAEEARLFLCEENRRLAREAAVKTMVCLLYTSRCV